MKKILALAVLTGCVVVSICAHAQPAQDTALDDRIQQLITQLGDADWNKRAAATEELKKIGKPALPKLREAATSKDEEVASRARALIKFIEPAAAAESASPPDVGGDRGMGGMQQMLQQMMGQGMGGMGNVPRAYFGVQLDPNSSPVKILQVVAGSPAEKAGLQADDELLEVGGQKIESVLDAMGQFSKFNPGDPVPVKIQRGDKTFTVKVVAGDRAQAGLGGMGGMPGMMNNPQIQQMLQQMMGGGGFGGVGGQGGGAADLQGLLANPQVQQMVQQFLQGQGGQGGAGGMMGRARTPSLPPPTTYSEGDKDYKITHKIVVEITEKKDGKEVKTTVEADSLQDLERKNMEAAEVYRKAVRPQQRMGGQGGGNLQQMLQQMLGGGGLGGQGAGGLGNLQGLLANPQLQQMMQQLMGGGGLGGFGGMGGVQQPAAPPAPAATVDLQESFGAKLGEVPGGLRVTELKAGTLAAKCGLMVGDIINKVNGREINKADDAKEMLGKLPPGKESQLEVTRRGETLTLTVKP